MGQVEKQLVCKFISRTYRFFYNDFIGFLNFFCMFFCGILLIFLFFFNVFYIYTIATDCHLARRKMMTMNWDRKKLTMK